jgi:capsular polysaccharide export protein
MPDGYSPFLRIPPFPGHKGGALTRTGHSNIDVQEIAAAIIAERVGGSFWSAQPDMDNNVILLAPDSEDQLQAMLARLSRDQRSAAIAPGMHLPNHCQRLPVDCDPWHLAASAREVWAGANQEIALVASLSGVSMSLFGDGRFAGCDVTPDAALAEAVSGWRYISPFTGEEWCPMDAITQLASWRKLIDANRKIDAVYGVAGWKRVTLDAMLWDGSSPVAYARGFRSIRATRQYQIAWKSRVASRLLAKLANSGAHVGEIEDGFIRSVGLGANCVPPLSTIVDFTGIYFDPNQESDLENILQKDKFDEKLCRRAAALKNRLIEAEISKYGQGRNDIKLTDINRYKVLVAGQVEDDRSICTGGAGMTNLELLARARTHAPDAHIIYKPHPDVVAGHRKGHVETADALRFADEIQNNAAITSLIEAVDGVHVITSLAGFEALLRGKAVTTHGVPFYAGWGLTKDLSEVPARRTRRLSLDELVAGTLLLYPRYTDPVTRLPCSAELLVERMAQGEARISTPLITLREWQGRLRLLLRSFIRRH